MLKNSKKFKNKFKKGDKVKVITGSFKGEIGDILKVLPVGTVVVGGVNLKNKRTKKGGQSERVEYPIHHSNVMHIDPTTDVVSRIYRKKCEDGVIKRFLCKTNHELA